MGSFAAAHDDGRHCSLLSALGALLQPAAYSNRLNADNLALSPFECHYWNIANWNETPG